MTQKFGRIFPAFLLFIISFLVAVHYIAGVSLEGDAVSIVWVYTDNIRRLFTDHFYDANIYYPIKWGAALQEYQPLNTLIFLPFYYLNAFEYGYYTTIFLDLVISALAVYKLSRILGANRFFAALIGLLPVVSPFVRVHVEHCQIIGIYLIIIPIICVLKFYETRKNHYLYGIVLCTFFNAFGPSYNGIISFELVGLLTLFMAWQTKNWSVLKNIVAGLVIAVILAFPFTWPYLKVLSHGMNRAREIEVYRMDVFLFLTPFQHFFGKVDLDNGRKIYPGLVFFAFCFLSLFWLRRKNNTTKGELAAKGYPYHLVQRLFVAVGFIYIFVACGTQFLVNGKEGILNPIGWFFLNYVPLFWATRFIPQYGFIGTVLLVIAGGTFVSMLWDKYGARISIPKTLQLVGCAVIYIAFAMKMTDIKPLSAYSHISFPQFEKPPQPYIEAAKIPNAHVIALPYTFMRPLDWVIKYRQELFTSVLFGVPSFNGITGFLPGQYFIAPYILQHFPSQDSAQFLTDMDLNTVVYEDDKMCKRMAEQPSPFYELKYHGCGGCVLSVIGLKQNAHYALDASDTISFGHEGNFWRFLPDADSIWSLIVSNFSGPDPTYYNRVLIERSPGKVNVILPSRLKNTLKDNKLLMSVSMIPGAQPLTTPYLHAMFHMNGHKLESSVAMQGKYEVFSVKIPNDVIQWDAMNKIEIFPGIPRQDGTINYHLDGLVWIEKIAFAKEVALDMTPEEDLKFNEFHADFGDGWLPKESWGRWSDGNSANVKVKRNKFGVKKSVVKIKYHFSPVLQKKIFLLRYD